MSKTYWSLNYLQEEWLHEIMMEYPTHLKDIGVYEMIDEILKERMYDRVQKIRLNELGKSFIRIDKKEQESLSLKNKLTCITKNKLRKS